MSKMNEESKVTISSIVREAVKAALARYDELLGTENMHNVLFDGSKLNETLREAAKEDVAAALEKATYEALTSASEQLEKETETDEDAFLRLVKGDNEEVH
jgi:hypothetical protein